MNWQAIKQTNFTDVEALSTFLELDGQQRAQLLKRSAFPLNLPKRLAQKIQKGTLDDPLLRQFVPLAQEDVQTPGFLCDPVSESSFHQGPRLLKKYAGRVLLLCTKACAMHCRYCFRRHGAADGKSHGFNEELRIIAADPAIQEVILSGGDPLSLSNSKLKALFDALEKIAHVKRVRFHTRFIQGIPERIDDEFCNLLEETRLQTVFVIHANHLSEFDEVVWKALKRVGLHSLIFHQAVLLKGVNDSVESLSDLLMGLVEHGIVPYYLHQLDKVQGAAHFEVSTERGKALVQELAKRLPGYAVPRYVREIPGEFNKTIL